MSAKRLADFYQEHCKDASGEQPKPTKAKPYLNADTEEWSKAVEYLKKGGNISDIEKKYKISDTAREMLMENAM